MKASKTNPLVKKKAEPETKAAATAKKTGQIKTVAAPARAGASLKAASQSWGGPPSAKRVGLATKPVAPAKKAAPAKKMAAAPTKKLASKLSAKGARCFEGAGDLNPMKKPIKPGR